MNEAKPFCISKREVWEAYKRVKANKGAAGVDEQSIEDFEKRLKNLYKIWNRMSSGSYFPPPVRTVKIPKNCSRLLNFLFADYSPKWTHCGLGIARDSLRCSNPKVRVAELGVTVTAVVF